MTNANDSHTNTKPAAPTVEPLMKSDRVKIDVADGFTLWIDYTPPQLVANNMMPVAVWASDPDMGDAAWVPLSPAQARDAAAALLRFADQADIDQVEFARRRAARGCVWAKPGRDA